jgi:uncharacterized LabA/DUF88 family protein
MSAKSSSIIPKFDLEKSSTTNFNQYINYMRSEKAFENVKRCRWAYEQYLKTCNVYEREQKKLEKTQEQLQEIEFVEG